MTTVRKQRKPPTPFGKRTEHFASYGKTGTGKSVDIERCANHFYEQDYKIIDLNNADGRLEGAFFSLPQQDPNLIEVLQDLPYECPPRGYPTEVYFSQYGFDPRRKYPALFKLFTLPLHDLEPLEFSILTSEEVTTPQEALMLGALSELKGNKNSNLMMLADKVEEIAQAGETIVEGMRLKGFSKKSIPAVHRLIRYLYETKLVTSGECPACLDIEAMLKNKNIIVFCWDNLPSRGKRGRMLIDFCQHYILRKIYDLKKTDKIKKKMLIILRESAVLLKQATPDLRNWLKDFVKQARGMEVQLYFDSQTPSQMPSDIQGQIEEIFIHRMTSNTDIDSLRRSHSAKLTSGLLKDVQSLEAGQVIWLSPHKETAVKTTMPAPRSHHRREGESFEVLWKELNMPMRRLSELKYIYKEFNQIIQDPEEPEEPPKKVKKSPKKQSIKKQPTEPEEEVIEIPPAPTPKPPSFIEAFNNPTAKRNHKMDAEMKNIEQAILKASGKYVPKEKRLRVYVTILYMIAKSDDPLTTKVIANTIDRENRETYNLLKQLESRELVKMSHNQDDEPIWKLTCELDID